MAPTVPPPKQKSALEAPFALQILAKPILKVFCRAFFQKSDRFSSKYRNFTARADHLLSNCNFPKSLRLLCRFHHVLYIYPITLARVVHKDVGDCADKLSVLHNR